MSNLTSTIKFIQNIMHKDPAVNAVSTLKFEFYVSWLTIGTKDKYFAAIKELEEQLYAYVLSQQKNAI